MTITDSAIILSRESWREADKRACFFTLHHGKLEAIAVGAHKIKSKLAGHLEPLRAVEVMFAEGARGFKIAQCVTRHNFFDAASANFFRARALGTLARFVNRVMEFHHCDAIMYEFLFRALAEIQSVPVDAIDQAVGQQLYKLAEHCGYAPEFNQCVVCGKRERLTRFCAALGGVICADERVNDRVAHFDGAKSYEHVYTFLKWRHLV